jgi:hypothetical protein
MAEIKSALELALERTASVASDKTKLVAHEAKQTGMRLAGQFMENPEQDLKRNLKSLEKEQRASARQGAFQVLLSHVALPTQEEDLSKLPTVEKGLTHLIRQKDIVENLMSQVSQLLQQYIDTRNQVVEQLRQQFEPRMRQKEEQLAQQTGRRTKLDPSSDPEFVQALEQNNDHLRQQYGAVIKQAKEQLTVLFEQE